MQVQLAFFLLTLYIGETEWGREVQLGLYHVYEGVEHIVCDLPSNTRALCLNTSQSKQQYSMNWT